MKIAVVTQLAWKSLPSRVASLSKAISKLLPEQVSISIVQKQIGDIPLTASGNVSKTFLKKILESDGYDGACLLFDRSQAKGVKLGLKGWYLRDGGFLEFWVCSTENAKDKSYFGDRRFERSFAHELLHGLYDWVGFKFPTPDEKRAVPGYDNTHYYDKTTRQIEKAYAEVAAAWPDKKAKQAKQEPVYMFSSDCEELAVKSAAEAVASGTPFIVPAGKTVTPVTIDKLEDVDPKLAEFARRLMKGMASIGHPMFVSEGFRSMERQAELYAQGRTKPGKVVTNAKPGESLHNTGRAVDIVFDSNNPWADSHPWELAGKVGESIAMAMGVKVSWGGRWAGLKDLPHWEL